MKLVVLHLLLRPTNEGLRYDTFVKRDLCNQNRPKRNLQTIYLLLLLRPTNEGPRYDRESVSLFYRSLSIYRSLLTHSEVRHIRQKRPTAIRRGLQKRPKYMTIDLQKRPTRMTKAGATQL